MIGRRRLAPPTTKPDPDVGPVPLHHSTDPEDPVARWGVETALAIEWTPAVEHRPVGIEVEVEVPFDHAGKRLPRGPLTSYYPAMASVGVPPDALSLLLEDDLRRFAALLIEAADKIAELDGPSPVSPGQLEIEPFAMPAPRGSGS